MNEKLLSVFTYYSAFAEEMKPSSPWRLSGWLWATQGHVLIAVKDDGSEADDPPEKFRKANKYLTGACDELLRPVSLLELRAFAGPVTPPKVPCDRCHGSGRDDDFGGESITCEHCGQITRQHCPQCGGDGVGWIEPRYARIAGLPLNLSLLAFGLSIVPDETAQLGRIASIAASKEADYQALLVVGETWRVVLMGIKRTDESLPEFRSEPPLYADAIAGAVA